MYDTYMFGVFPLGRSSILWRFDSARSIRQTGIHKIAFSKNSQKSYKRNIFNMKIVLRRAWKDAFNELSHVYMCAIWKIDWRPLVRVRVSICENESQTGTSITAYQYFGRATKMESSCRLTVRSRRVKSLILNQWCELAGVLSLTVWLSQCSACFDFRGDDLLELPLLILLFKYFFFQDKHTNER